MKVRVKPGKTGFIYGILRKENQEFNLMPVKHSVDVDKNGDPVVITEEQQFSNEWMTKVEKSKSKPGPKPKSEKQKDSE